jgi:hypothetical protein
LVERGADNAKVMGSKPVLGTFLSPSAGQQKCRLLMIDGGAQALRHIHSSMEVDRARGRHSVGLKRRNGAVKSK